MLTEPTEQDKLRARRAGSAAVATVTVTTVHGCRYPKPESDASIFGMAAANALADAVPAGYEAVAYDSVTEFIVLDPDEEGDLLYRYEWEFTAHKG